MIPEIIKRRTIRQYSDKKVSEKDITEIIKAAQFAPTGMNTRAVEYIVVKDKKSKEQIAEIMNQKQFIKDAPILIIPVSDTTKSPLFIQDLSIASSYIQLQAVACGLGSVWKHAYPDQVEKVKKLLHIPDNVTFINMLAIGYAKEKKDVHTDAEFDIKKIHHEQW
jgi:nitroreductase